jgi:phospholipid-translocating P-type ATPase (flippase)
MSESDYEKFDSAYQEAAASLKNREEQVEEICDRAEREFDLIGATAIEDKLQEGVPEAIDYFIKAGIKFWIITGDKQETAINIAKSCNLIQLGVTIVKVNVTSNEQCGAVLKKAEQVVSSNPRCALVIDGGSLTFALGEHQPALLSVCIKCEAVVCCRATPLQKALIVRMVKRGQKAICLSIGDGANDVSMIQEAHIGVGIFGKEGTQAARSADYSIYMFKHLRRLVCVHGRYNMVRATGLINYSFYKNTAMFIVQLWFAFYNGFSAQTLYDSIVMAVFNVIITFLPPFFFCIFERDVKEYSIDQNPQAYRQIVRGDHSFGIQTLWYWVASMVWHSIGTFKFL